MSNDFIASFTRKLNLRLMFVSLGGLVLVGIGLLVGARYLYNMLLGPFVLNRDELLALENPASRLQYYVAVQGDDHASTGYTYVSRSDSGRETTEAYYHALLFGRRLLMVKSATSEIGDQVTGALVSMPSDVQREVVGALESDMPEVKGAFLPMMLDATNFYTSGYIGLAVAAVLGLLSTAGAGLAVYRLTSPQAHPALKALAKYGALESVTGEIDMEMAAAHEQVGKKFHLTRRWLVSTANGLQAVPYRDIIWCYKQVTQHRTNGIPTFKSYAAHVLDRHGKRLVLPGKEAEVDGLLQTMARLAPGMAMGYSNDLNQLWKKDRAGFAAAVDRRRASPAA